MGFREIHMYALCFVLLTTQVHLQLNWLFNMDEFGTCGSALEPSNDINWKIGKSY